MKETLSGGGRLPAETKTSRIRSYMVRTDVSSGAKFGGATTTQAGSTGTERPSTRTVALTGPSEMSSCQPSLLAKCVA
ncbi:hypothetical protein SPURM210S_04120 [Streptomyces purpurascens]